MFMVLPTPPSMRRRSPTVTGGHAPGTAQLAATASTSAMPESRSSTSSSPVATSMAVTRSTRSGQSCDGSRCAMTSRRTGSATVAVSSATAPMRCRFCSGRRPGLPARP